MTAEAKPILKEIPFTYVKGWAADDHAAALAAFQRSCREIVATGHGFGRRVKFGGTRKDWLEVCGRALHATHPRQFFEAEFTPLTVADPVRPHGLFTGYYEPEAEGSRTPGNGFDVPIYRKPPDLVGFDEATERQTGLKYGRMLAGKPTAYFTRREIEEGALRSRQLELVWLRSWVDAFFIHVQGSGRIRFADGSFMRLAYGAKTGQPYTGVGGLLVERGVLTKDNMSMQAIRKWMAENPDAARALMWENKSFIFFREVKVDDEALGAPGAQKVSLTPLRSLAVDRSLWMFGTPIWLDADVPTGSAGQMQAFRHLMVAQDTGTAIKGYVRGDVYWGWGEKAALVAGQMKSAGSMTVLLPKKTGAPDFAGEMKRKNFEVNDRGLWDEVARTIRPLGKSALKFSTAPAVLSKQVSLHIPPKSAAPKPAFPKSPPPIAGFDRRTEQKLMRGKVEIESRIDLHGMGLEEARIRLLDFIGSRRKQGLRLLLVITGKGASPFAGHTLHGRAHFHVPEREGRLRRQLPDWLHEAEFRTHVAGFQPAHPKHGGGGAFYVRLRRNRDA